MNLHPKHHEMKSAWTWRHILARFANGRSVIRAKAGIGSLEDIEVALQRRLPRLDVKVARGDVDNSVQVTWVQGRLKSMKVYRYIGFRKRLDEVTLDLIKDAYGTSIARGD